MRHPTKRTAVLVLLSLLASLLTVTATVGTAAAAESVPTLHWPAVNVSQYNDHTVTAPNGDVTVPCATLGSGSDLVTYNSSGQVVRQLDHTSYVDGVQNCLNNPVVDKNGTLYGVPYGKNTSNTWVYGPNVLAYSGNTLKWKYPAYCSNQRPQVAVGGDGNIYVTTYGHLIGLAPDLAAGQTQPTKVVDITIPTDCSIQLFPYKDGIMLHAQSSSNFYFYSYTGQTVSTTTDSQGSEKVNGDGRLFTWSTVAGSYTSISTSVYDPDQQNVMWTTSASTSGANTSGGPNLYPMKDGGVAVLSTEQKMVGGVPASPTQWVQGLSVINAAGIKTRSFQLPTNYSNGSVTGSYDTAMTITSDTTGKLVVVRELMLNTNMSWPNPATVPAIDIGVYDPVSDTWPYHQVMSGDLAKSGGPDGYQWNYGANSVSIAGNTVYLMAACTNNCNGDYNTKLYAIQVSGIGMDYPRGDVTTNSPRPTTSYIALGDSFSSGEGNPPFLDGTDIATVNTCHRSNAAYPELISGTTSKIPALGTNGFRACSGAVSNNVWNNPQWNEGIQLDWWPDTTTQLVTMTMGGNDIGFANFAQACVSSTCQVGSTAYNNTLNAINNTLPGALKTTYEHILTYAPNAQIYVMDYPQVVAAKSTSDADDTRCPYMYNNGANTTNSPYYPWEDDFAARDIVTKLDAQISTVIKQVRGENADYSARLHYVSVNGTDSPFAGHAICDSGTSYFQNVDQIGNNTAYVFHPNASGQAAYAQLMAAAINAG